MEDRNYIKMLFDKGFFTEGQKQELMRDFPELAESEDERIRKWIIEEFKIHYDFVSKSLNPMVEKALAWLEKQKEQGRNITANLLEDGITGVQRELIEFLANNIDASWVDVIKSADAYAQRIRSMFEKQKEEEGYELIPMESTLEYKLGFKAGKESEKQKESLHIEKTCKENADSFTDEDERIRKYFIWVVKNIFDNIQGLKLSKEQTRELIDNYNGIKVSDMLAWLEKQKPMYNLEIPAGDVAPAEEEGPFDEDEFLEDELSAFLQNYDKEYDDDAAVSDVARHFYEIGKKQKEPLTPEEKMNHRLYLEGFDVGKKVGETLKEQKQDTRDADDLQLLGFIYDLLNEIEWKDNWAMSKDECLRRLNNYRPQKHTEWSEEDEDKVDDICKLIEHATIIPRSGDDDTGIPPTRLNDKYKGELKAFVKSIRNRPTKSDTWKPSEEQMEVDLDFQVFAEEMDAVFNLPKEETENTEENPLNWEYAIARHFYEFGKNSK